MCTGIMLYMKSFLQYVQDDHQHWPVDIGIMIELAYVKRSKGSMVTIRVKCNIMYVYYVYTYTRKGAKLNGSAQ